MNLHTWSSRSGDAGANLDCLVEDLATPCANNNKQEEEGDEDSGSHVADLLDDEEIENILEGELSDNTEDQQDRWEELKFEHTDRKLHAWGPRKITLSQNG